MMPARSPGANPVRHTTASSGDVNQATSLMPTGPRSCASTSAITANRTRARPSMRRPCSRALRPIRASGTSTVTNASLRTAAPVNTAWSWLFACLASAGRVGRRWLSATASVRRRRRERYGPSAGSHRSARSGPRLRAVGTVRRRTGPADPVGHPDPGMGHPGGHRPGAGRVVLDDRDPRLGRAVRWAVVHLHRLQHPRQIRLIEIVDPAVRALLRHCSSAPCRRPGGRSRRRTSRSPTGPGPAPPPPRTSSQTPNAAKAAVHRPRCRNMNTGSDTDPSTISCPPRRPNTSRSGPGCTPDTPSPSQSLLRRRGARSVRFRPGRSGPRPPHRRAPLDRQPAASAARRLPVRA